MAEKLITAADIEEHVGSVPDKGDRWNWPGRTLSCTGVLAAGWGLLLSEECPRCMLSILSFTRGGLVLSCCRLGHFSTVRLERYSSNSAE